MKTVTAIEAGRNFARLLDEASRGHSITIVSHGQAIATLGPPVSTASTQKKNKTRLLQRLYAQTPTGTRTWSRDKLYD